ncbi:MAG: hypothetical protein ACF8QF_02195 [Phycisphaerales bacterium]
MQRCACGARVQYRREQRGRTVRCPGCGEALRLGRWPARRAQDDTSNAERRATALAERRRNGFVADAFWTLTYPQRPANWGAWLGAAFLLAFGALGMFATAKAGTRGALAFALVGGSMLGLLSAYLLVVVRYTAGGEDGLPRWFGGDIELEDVWPALMDFLGAAGVPLLPGMLLALAAYFGGASAGDALAGSWPLLALGTFLWPASLIMAATLGVEACVRVDIMAKTILAAPGAYLATWLLLLGGVAVALVMAEAFGVLRISLWPLQIDLGSLFRRSAAHTVGALALSVLVVAHIALVWTRAVGLFYRHFSCRFPWSAG